MKKLNHIEYKPFHNLKFKPQYVEKADPNHRVEKPMEQTEKKARKEKVYVTTDMFKKLVGIYQTSGRPGAKTFFEDANLSHGAVTTWLDKARQWIADNQVAASDIEELKNQIVQKDKGINQREDQIAALNRQLETIGKMRDELCNGLRNENQQLKLTIEKLKAKIEVLTDLVKGN